MSMLKKAEKIDEKILLAGLEQQLHDLGQPLLGIRFGAELLISQVESISQEALGAKLTLMIRASEEANAILSRIGTDLEKLKKYF